MKERYPECELDVNHTVITWLPRHIAWSSARFKGIVTLYRVNNGTDYKGSIVPFGDTVLAKIGDISSQSKAKS